KVPALFSRKVDTGCVREPAERRAILITLLDVDTRGIGEPGLRAHNQVAPATPIHLAVVRPLVFERIVQVETSALGIEKTGPDSSSRPCDSAGCLTVELKAFRQAIRAASADAIIVLTVPGCRDCALDKTVCAPGGARIELHLRDRVGAFALLLRQGNNRRIILAQVVAYAGAHGPSFGHPVAHVQLDGPGFESLILDSLIALGHEAQTARHRHPERAAVLLGVLDRRLSRRRITGFE